MRGFIICSTLFNLDGEEVYTIIIIYAMSISWGLWARNNGPIKIMRTIFYLVLRETKNVV